MKICFIGPAVSAHIVKWAHWFKEHGDDVHVISFTDGNVPDATVHSLNLGIEGSASELAKIGYLFKGRQIKALVNKLNPDIINVHYATSYGTAVALSGIKGYVLSVWGADIYDFPNKSPFHKAMLKYSLRKAQYLFSTSQAMADEAHRYTNKEIVITPFGVDTDLFSPEKRMQNMSTKFVIGTVKTLKPKYGIDYLLRAVAIVKKQEPEIPIKLRIAGSGPNEDEYRRLGDELNLDIDWLGYISQEQAAVEWANMNIAVIPSTLDSESFGVSAVEAESSGTPVIISDIPGLMEATRPGITSIVVPRKNEKELAKAILDLYKDANHREELGKAGREFVLEKYSIDHCFNDIRKFFLQIIDK